MKTETIQADIAAWEGDLLTGTFNYDWPSPHAERFGLQRVPLNDPTAIYFCAVDGQAFGLCKAIECETCIANVERLLRLAGANAIYVTFGLKSRTPAALAAWRSKWSKRTLKPDPWDASVRSSTPIGA